MSKRADFRFLWIDLSILLAILFIGWAIFRLTKTEPNISQESSASQELRSVFEQCQALVRESMQNPERTRRKSDLEWQETMLLEDEYVNIGERLRTEVPALAKALDEHSKRETAQPLAKMQDLKVWIQTLKDRARVERLDNKSKELKERMLWAQVSGTTPSIMLAEDLGTLIADLDRTYQSYFSNFTAIAENRGKPLVSGSTTEHVAAARQAVSRLSELAEHARQQSQSIDSWLEQEPRSKLA